MGLIGVVGWHVEERGSVAPTTSPNLLDLLLMPHSEVAEPPYPSLGLRVVPVALLAESQNVPKPVKLAMLTQ